MSNAARTLAPSVPLVHPVAPSGDVDPQIAAELDNWLAWRGDDYAVHPEPCPCDDCRSHATPALVQAVAHHQPTLERAIGRLGLRVEIVRTYRTTDDGTTVALAFRCDEQSDQLRLDERAVLLRARDELLALGFYVLFTGANTIRIDGYYGRPVVAPAAAAKPALAKASPSATAELGEERAA